MIPIKSEEEINKMRQSCQIAALVLERLSSFVSPGVNTYDLDQSGRKLIRKFGATSACYNYRIGNRRFPAYTCISVNEEIVHGIGSLKRVLQSGDAVTIDVTVIYDGYIGDNARTVLISPANPVVEKLVRETERALYRGIERARSGNRVGDISHSVQRYIEPHKFAIVRDFVGHGVGRSMHEEPQIPNFGRPGTGMLLKPHMTLAIEPMVNLGGPEIELAPDGWTAVTQDGKPSAHFEHTVLVTDGPPEILTRAEN